MDFYILSVSQSSSGKFARASFDRKYMERLKNGDSKTEQHFIDYFGKLLHVKLSTRLHDTQMIEHLIQETFFRVFTALRLRNCLHPPEQIGALVNTVCQELLADLYDSRSGLQESLSSPLHKSDHFLNAGASLSNPSCKHQLHQILESCSAKDRELLRLIFEEETDKDEICRRFGIDRNYLQALLRHAKMKLRVKLWDE